jgi:cytochrome c-type biogenesis protein CcmH
VIAALLLISSLLLPQTSTMSDSVLDARTREVGLKLRCPTCQGLSIADSPAAGDMRELIREQLKAGKTPAEVEAYFVSRFGDWILLKPPATGFNLALYVMPAVLILGGLLTITMLARKWSRAGDGSLP